jgi:hypothetical protein
LTGLTAALAQDGDLMVEHQQLREHGWIIALSTRRGGSMRIDYQ